MRLPWENEQNILTDKQEACIIKWLYADSWGKPFMPRRSVILSEAKNLLPHKYLTRKIEILYSVQNDTIQYLPHESTLSQ